MIKKVAILLLLLVGQAQAVNLRRFQIDDLANPAKAEKNEIALNLNLEDLWIYKQDIDTLHNPSAPQYRIKDLADPAMADYNTNALRVDLEDLYNFKLSISSPTKTLDSFISDILDPEKSEENTGILNTILDDLWTDKVDK